jgi:hypothetical protein
VGTRLRRRIENACDVERTFRVRQMERRAAGTRSW